MRLAVTGTPGTGKTTATDLVESEYGIEIVHCNDLIENEGISTKVDAERDSAIVDLEALEARLADHEDCMIESHLAHHLPADRVAVLRCDPAELEARLLDRGEPEPKARENAESEALDVVLAEAVNAHGRNAVYEIDTSDRTPDAVADDLHAVWRGDREPSAGTVDFVGYLA